MASPIAPDRISRARGILGRLLDATPKGVEKGGTTQGGCRMPDENFLFNEIKYSTNEIRNRFAVYELFPGVKHVALEGLQSCIKTFVKHGFSQVKYDRRMFNSALRYIRTI